MLRNDFQQHLDEDWIDFRREVCDLYDRKPDLTIAQVARIFGADFDDVKRALMQGDRR
jgi:hypothetical protein